MIGSAHLAAVWSDGLCHGTLWREQQLARSPSSSSLFSSHERTCDYCIAVGVRLECYESLPAYQTGCAPLCILSIVGASAWHEDSLRLVSNQGTHVYCQAPSKHSRDTWLAALHAGLEQALKEETPPRQWPPPSPQATLKRTRAGARYCVSCGVVEGTKALVGQRPIPHHGKESRVDVCGDCADAQGLLDHLQSTLSLMTADCHHRRAMEQAQLLLADVEAPPSESSSWTEIDDRSSSTPSPPSPKSSSWHAVEASSPPEAAAAAWIHLPPTEQSTQAVLDIVRGRDFAALARQSPILDRLQKELLAGAMSVGEFLEQLAGDANLALLKKQAFQVAGDMGTAMKLLSDTALPIRETYHDNEVLRCILDFFLDLIEDGELSSVAFFWPQLCHLHLRMLPPTNAAELARVELYEDFLLTVACRHSIHLALALVWSHTADLQESLAPPCASTCRRRRHAVMRFVCELESLLFDFDQGWGGGSVSLGKMLSPTGHQVELLRSSMLGMQALRKQSSTHLSRSFRYHVLSTSKFDQPPEQAAEEKLRIARNADYFSSHLNFSARICDIAEKLRFMDIDRRASALEQELAMLNSSGAMGGDPLNQVRESLLRVARVPETEGHVFRSKERTPVLLLMEVLDESVEAERRASLDPLETDETAADEAAIGDDPTSPIPEPPGVEILEGSIHESRFSPRLTGLKRFSSAEELSEPQMTPRHDVEVLVNSAMEQQQFDNLVLPDLTLPVMRKPVLEPIRTTATRESATAAASDEVAAVVESPSKEAAAPSPAESPSKAVPERRGSKKISTLGTISGSPRDAVDAALLAPTGDVRREVLNAIMMRGIQGNTIAAGAADAVQRSLKELERQRATELLLSDTPGAVTDPAAHAELEKTREKLLSLGIGLSQSPSASEEQARKVPTEEDEVMEAIRLLLIQNRVAQGQLSPADAAKVLQHTSLSRSNSAARLSPTSGQLSLDPSEMPTIDAGDVDRRLVGCGSLPPAILQALTLWKGDMVTNAELLELVKKDLEFLRHSVLLEAEHVEKLNEDSAFWGRFAFGERWAEKKARIAATSPMGTTPGWDLVGVIVKSNDDLRQEAFVMQLIELCQEAFELAGLELWVNPYCILATGRSTGVIEMVRNAMSFDALKKRPGYGKGGLREHLQRMTEFTADPGEAFKSAQRNFVRSLAAYSLMSYFFMFKDRHNGNILLDTAGHVIHIDFGFVFGIAPGGSFSLEMSTPFKLTEEMLDVMGGLKSPLFSEFVTLFCCGFLALKSYSGTFLTIVEIMCKGSTFKCFDGRDTEDIVSKLRERFCPELSKEETVAFALDLIKQATTSYGTKQYDMFQYLSQGIAT